MAEPCLAVSRLTVVRGARLVVKDISFDAEAGSLTAILGPNGAGKSTVLKAIMGLLPFTGSIAVEGIDVAVLGARDRARRAAYVPQHSALDASIAVRDVVAQGRYAHHDGWGRETPADDDAVLEAMRQTDTVALGPRLFNQLSYGERRRVLLARALATGAKLLLLDEPTAALDVGQALRLFALLRALAGEGRCVVAVLHQLHDAVAKSDQALIMSEGQRVAHGPAAEVIAPETVRRVYGVDLIPGAHFGYALPREEAPE